MKTIAVVGTLDTKGEEHAFVAGVIRSQGHAALLIDVGGLDKPQVRPDITREEVAAAAGIDLPALAARKDRGEMIAALARAAPAFLSRLAGEGRIHGVISLGGTGGTAIGTAAMRALPIGFPKVMVSTVASGNVAPYVGVKDIVMIPSIVDVAGLNRVSRQIFTEAAGAVCGMVSAVAAASASPAAGNAKPLIVASMFGNTTKAVEHARRILEAAGYEVLVFHATGAGGRTMESLVETGLVAGVLDITTTEWADELVGGVLNAGPARLEAAARRGVPAIIAPGCLDMVNFGPPETVPAKFAGRKFYPHNPQVTLMRTTPARKRGTRPDPRREGQSFHGPRHGAHPAARNQRDQRVRRGISRSRGRCRALRSPEEGPPPRHSGHRAGHNDQRTPVRRGVRQRPSQRAQCETPTPKVMNSMNKRSLLSVLGLTAVCGLACAQSPGAPDAAASAPAAPNAAGTKPGGTQPYSRGRGRGRGRGPQNPVIDVPGITAQGYQIMGPPTPADFPSGSPG